LLAQQRGYYKDAGLDVTIDTGNGSASAISLVAGGAYDVASADLSTMIEFNTANQQSKLAAVAIQYDLNPNSVMVRKDGASRRSRTCRASGLGWRSERPTSSCSKTITDCP